MKNYLVFCSMAVLSVVLFGCGEVIPTDNVPSPAMEEFLPMVPVKDDPALAGKWIWEKTVMNNDTIVTPKKADVFSITFDLAEKKISGTTDCNGIFGEYTFTENGISFSPMAMTRMFCQDSQETEFSNMIADATGYMFTKEGDLVLLLKLDSGAVVFKKGETTDTLDFEKICTGNNGKWFAEYKECEAISPAICEKSGGTFNYCGSDCRHGESESDPNVFCTMSCVRICTFE
jgi:heat shock protein HslJ